MTDVQRIYLSQRGVRGAPGATVTAQAGNAVALRSQMAAIASPLANQLAVLTEAGREGNFAFSTANHATDVTNDPQQGIYVAPSTDVTGASGAWVRKFPGQINVKWFGAKGDANSAGSTGTDDTSGIQAALNYIGTLGGGTLYFPEGNYKVTSYLTFPTNCVLRGAGRKISKIVGTHAGGGGANAAENARNGSILVNWQTINTTTRIDCTIEHLWLFNSNASNQGAGIYQQSGSVFTIHECEIAGSKYGVIFDQTENARIENCELSSGVSGGIALWLVNGSALNASASADFTNVIQVRGGQVNPVSGSYGVIDDGGETHIYDGINFNGGLCGIRAAGVNGLVIINPYAESQGGDIISLNSTTLGGTATGGSVTSIIGGQFSATAGHAAIKGTGSPGTLIVNGGDYSGGGGTNPLSGAAAFYQIYLSGYNNASSAAVFADGVAGGGGTHVDLSKVRADGKVGAVNTSGVTGGSTCSPGASAGFFEMFNPAGVRQGYLGFLQGTALQFSCDGSATSFQFLSPLSCTSSIGYGTGAGGAVTQATSRATGVTLNKVCGQITLFSAAGSATWQTFTVTNSQVAATDVVRVNQASGTDKYMIHVTHVGAGTFDVTFATTGGTTTEAPVFNFSVLKAVAA